MIVIHTHIHEIIIVLRMENVGANLKNIFLGADKLYYKNITKNVNQSFIIKNVNQSRYLVKRKLKHSSTG